ncbi:30S ribosomal protein S9 [Candidatus Daviesbacteria bacterium]|nr:30S ribosomal protein S9 [Candidatus Daviesbacteria bacterium]
MADAATPTTETKKNKSYHQAVGRRKEAIARVRLFSGQGQLTVNGKPIAEYFKGQIFQKAYQKPFEITKTLGKFTGTVKVEGGGTSSQLDAVIHGISRALEQANKEAFRPLLKTAGLLTRDARVKERRKFGLAHKARAKKQSPKR